MSSFWLSSGAVIVDGSGLPILCDTCPCIAPYGNTPCTATAYSLGSTVSLSIPAGYGTAFIQFAAAAGTTYHLDISAWTNINGISVYEWLPDCNSQSFLQFTSSTGCVSFTTTTGTTLELFISSDASSTVAITLSVAAGGC